MDNSMMQMMMQMMMNQTQMMAMMMQQMNTPAQQGLAQQQAISTPTINFETNSQTNDIESQLNAMRAEIESLKSQLTEATQTIKQYKQSYEKAMNQIQVLKSRGPKMEEYNSQIEGQLTLADEAKYQSRHGSTGHDTYSNIVSQLSDSDKEKVRYSDSEEVFDTEEEAKKEGISFEDAWNRHHDDKIGDNITMVSFEGSRDESPVNEFGF